MPPAGSLKVLRAPAPRGGIWCAPKTKIYNLETDEFVSNPPFSKIYPTFGGNNSVCLKLFLKFLKLFFKSDHTAQDFFFEKKLTVTEP
jgi:hypothetical protein